MCSITINKTADDILARQSEKDRRMIERRLVQFAQDASVSVKGALDTIAPMTRMSGDLKQARKKTIGRHRVYYTGFHTQCSYRAFFVKPFKKAGVDDEDDPRFQNTLFRAMDDREYRELA